MRIYLHEQQQQHYQNIYAIRKKCDSQKIYINMYWLYVQGVIGLSSNNLSAESTIFRFSLQNDIILIPTPEMHNQQSLHRSFISDEK